MANTFNTMKDAPGLVAKMTAALLQDKLQFCKSIDQAPAEDYKGKNGYGAGDTIQISKPARYTPQNTFDITSSIQDSTEEKVGLALDIISTVGIEADSLEFASEIELQNFMTRIIEPAVSAIAQDVEQQMLQKAIQATANTVGTAGSTTFDIATVLSSRTKMNKFLAPKDNKRCLLLDSDAGASAVNARSGLFQSSSEIEKQYKQGLVGMADGFKWLENELLYTHTNGTDVTGVAVNDAATTTAASTLAVDGLTTTTGTVTKGSVFTIAGVNAVHPITKQDLGVLQQFTATALATADGSGDATVSISPTIYSSASGSLQNVSALPADDAALVFVGAASTAYVQNLAFHKSAFRMVSVPLVMPTKAEFAAQSTEDGITVAIVRDWDILQRRMVTRIDFLGGLAPVREEWACRITA